MNPLSSVRPQIFAPLVGGHKLFVQAPTVSKGEAAAPLDQANLDLSQADATSPVSSESLASTALKTAEQTALSSSGSFLASVGRFLTTGSTKAPPEAKTEVVDRAPTTLTTLEPERRVDQKFLDKYGPWAVVTGASSGIGAAMAEELAGKGMNVVLTARRGDKLQDLAEELSKKYGIEARPLSCDLSAPDFMTKLDRDTKDLDVGLLVNNAGSWEFGSFLENDLERELQVLEVNAKAPLIMSHHFGKKMAEKGRGGMVFVSSGAAYAGVANQANYSASKAYGLNLAESLNLELKGKGIDVLAVTPGPVTTQGAADAHVDFSKLPPTMAPVSAEQVARESFSKLGKKVSHTPGVLSRISLNTSLRVLGRNMHSSLASYFFGRAMGG